MELILASAGGVDERVIDCEFDFEIGGENTFELTMPYSMWSDDITFKKRVYVAGTEYGGIIKAIAGDTSKDSVFVSGYTWRGILNKRFVIPDTYIGDLNRLIEHFVQENGVFKIPSENAGRAAAITVSEYTPVEQVISEACRSVGYRFDISYIGDKVVLSAVPADTVSYEVSQDEPIDFKTEDNRMGINHLQCIGKNDTVHVYADEAGNVSLNQTLYGIDEYTDILISSTEDRDKLIEEGEKELKEKSNFKDLTAYLATAEEMRMGDFITGHDYITGITMTKPIVQKIVTYKDGDLTITTKIEGES